MKKFALLLTLAAAVGSADSIYDISIDEPCNENGILFGQTLATCALTSPDFESGVIGGADFSPVGFPWSFSFRTDNSFSGPFDMTGPNGLTFSGVVTSGESLVPPGVSLSFSGQWSDGVFGHGTASISVETRLFSDAQLSSIAFTPEATPEAPSFLLLGAGAIGFGMIKLRQCKKSSL